MNIGLAIALICLFGFVGFAIGGLIASDRLKTLSNGTLYITKNNETYLELEAAEVLQQKHGYVVFFVQHVDE